MLATSTRQHQQQHGFDTFTKNTYQGQNLLKILFQICEMLQKVRVYSVPALTNSSSNMDSILSAEHGRQRQREVKMLQKQFLTKTMS